MIQTKERQKRQKEERRCHDVSPSKDQNSPPKKKAIPNSIPPPFSNSTLQIKNLILPRLLPPRLRRKHNPPPLPPPALDKKLRPIHPPRRPRPPHRRRTRPTAAAGSTRRRNLGPLPPLPKPKVEPIVDDQRRRRRPRMPVAAERRPRRSRDGSGLGLLLLLEMLLEAMQRALLVEARCRGERRVQTEGVPFDAGAGGGVGAAAGGGGAGGVGGGAGGGHGGGVAGLSVVVVEVWEMHVGVVVVFWVVEVGWWLLLGGGRGSEASVAAEAVEDAVGRVVFVLGEAEHYLS